MNEGALADYKDILTVEDIMEILKIGKNSAYSLVKEGRIKSIKIGNKYRVPKASMIEFLASFASM